MSPIQSWDLWAETWLGLQPFLFLILIAALFAVILSTPKERTGPLFGVGMCCGGIGLALGLFSGLSDLGAATGALATAAALILGFMAVTMRSKTDTPHVTAMLGREIELFDAQGKAQTATDEKGIPLKEMSPLKVMLGVTLLMLGLIVGMFWGQGIAGIRANERTIAAAEATEAAAIAAAAREAVKARLDAALAEAAAAAKARRAAEAASNASAVSE